MKVMARTVTDYYAIWRSSLSLCERYASNSEKENLVKEQFGIKENAVKMMAKTPAASKEEILMKLRVAAYECGVHFASKTEASPRERLKHQILQDVESFVALKVPEPAL